jgi:hypothetical protein
MGLLVRARACSTSEGTNSGAVQPHRGHLGHAVQRGHAVRQRFALAVVFAVAARKTDPGLHRRKLGQQVGDGQCFGQAGQGLAGQQVGPGVGQHLQPGAVEGGQGLARHVCVAAVFRAVGQHGTVRPHRGSHQGFAPAGAVERVRPEGVAGFAGQLDGTAHQVRRLVVVQTPPRERFKGGLVAGCGGHVGTREEIVQVDLPDQVGLLDQQLGRPQRVLEVGAAPLQFGGQGAVEHEKALVGQGLLQGVGVRVHVDGWFRWKAVGGLV